MLINKILGIFAELPYFFPKIQSIQSIVQSYYISKSLRFRGSSTYLSRTPSVTGNRRVWTWSGWIKRASLGTTQYLYSSFNAGTNECAIRFNTDNTLEIEQYTSPSYNYRLVTTQVFRDTGAWFHLVVSADTTQLLESSRIRVFINGQEIEDFSTSLYPSRNYDTNFNLISYTHQIGAWNTSAYFDGYMADVHFVDGDSLLPSSFGEINLLTGVWIPKSYTGFYGTNGFNLRFDDNSSASATAIGKDSSGNGNNWTPNGISMTVGTTYDSILDTPLLSSNNLYYSGWNPNYGLQFRSSASTYLTRTPSASNRRTWTWSGWIKRGIVKSTSQVFFGARDSGTTIYGYMRFDENDKLNISLPSFPSMANNYRITNNKFTDSSVWYHICFVCDSTLTLPTDRIKVYVNNVLQSCTELNANQNDENGFNAAIPHSIGRYGASSSDYFDGYLAEINFIDGLALTPSSFAETDSNGRWVPKAYTGSYGANGFYLNFANRSAMTQAAIGDDASINNNQFQPNNMLITDAIDFNATASLGNYATLSLFKKINTATLINSNLTVSPLGPDGAVSTNFGMVNGKWYWEVTVDTSNGGSLNVGIVNQNNTSWNIGDSVNGAVYNSGGNKFYNNAYNTYGATYTTNDIIGVAYDADLGDLYFYKNGILQGGGAAFTGLSRNVVWDASLSHNGSSSSRTVHINFGQRPFSYTPPAGFLALNTNNLPTPTITNSANYMAANTYTGISVDKSITNTVNSASFQPDLVWIKSRNITGSHHIFDSTRGSSLALFTDGTVGNNSRPNSFTSFNSAGFTVGNSNDGNTNVLGTNYITWQWKKNITAGLDIVTYAGTLTTSGNTAINHNLGVAPKFIISKSLNTNGNDVGNWFVWHASAGTDNFLRLNTIDKTISISGGGGGTMIAPTSSVFYAPYISGSNVSGNNYIAYVFAEIAGYSKFGNYTGNGNADGPFVFCGFRPRFIMVKRTDVTGDWYIVDTARSSANGANVIDQKLYPNISVVENGGSGESISSNNFDILSNGFKPRTINGNTNASVGTYIFAAFAETPNKYALAESSINLNKAPENIATNSLRFRSSASAYLSRTFGADVPTYTLSLWCKRGALGTVSQIAGSRLGGVASNIIAFDSSDRLYFEAYNTAIFTSTAVFRDPSAWYHVVLRVTQSGTAFGYVNNIQVASGSVGVYSALFKTGYTNVFGRAGDLGLSYFDGYMTEVNFVDGQALSPIAFGEINSVTGVWTPRRYTGSYGTNGFYLKFGNTASLGQDSSGKGNNWTPNNFSISTSTAVQSITTTGTTTWTAPEGVKSVRYLVVGGGGAGGGPDTGGGGGGGMVEGTLPVTAGQSYAITVGAGGGTGGNAQGQSGGNSIFHTITGYGGGAYKVNGGSGGGGGNTDGTNNAGGSIQTSPVSGTGYGNRGGNKISGGSYAGGGGGGAGGVGGDATGLGIPGVGGAGRASSITGTSVTYAGGGAGDGFYGVANGGSGGGGASGANGTNGLGGGGGGNGGLGGSGIVILSYDVSSSTYDVMTDVPVNYDDGGNGRGNYAVLNPLKNGGLSISNANLIASQASASWLNTRSTIQIPVGDKFYCEFVSATSWTSNNVSFFGLANEGLSLTAGFADVANIYTTTTLGEVLGLAIDRVNHTYTTYRNNSQVGTGSISATANLEVAVGCYQASGSVNFGQRPFAYTPPAGFKALNTNNLPTPAIINPAEYMAATTYTGTGAAQRVRNNVNNVSFKPDLVWIKDRSNGVNTSWSHVLFDSVRGIHPNGSPYLCTNETSIETGLNNGFGLTSLNNNGFSLINNGTLTNTLNDNYIAWQWKEGVTQGFDIVTYTGNGSGSARSVAHNLGVAPRLIITKGREAQVTGTDNWLVWHGTFGAGDYLILNSNAGKATATAYWGNTVPNSSNFFVGGAASNVHNEIGKNYVAYCFAEITGFSRFGSYTGNGSTTGDGPFVFCGFRPRFVMIKRTDSSNNWHIFDSGRSINNGSTSALSPYLLVDSNVGDNNNNTGTSLFDILSNGFKLKDGLAWGNATGGTYIFAAFAEAPFKYSLAR